MNILPAQSVNVSPQSIPSSAYSFCAGKFVLQQLFETSAGTLKPTASVSFCCQAELIQDPDNVLLMNR